MHLRCILNPFYPLTRRERVNRLGEWAVMEICWLLPRYLVYWVCIRAAAAAAGPDRNPTTLTAIDLITHYEGKRA